MALPLRSLSPMFVVTVHTYNIPDWSDVPELQNISSLDAALCGHEDLVDAKRSPGCHGLCSSTYSGFIRRS